jgi:hypothetical protein
MVVIKGRVIVGVVLVGFQVITNRQYEGRRPEYCHKIVQPNLIYFFRHHSTGNPGISGNTRRKRRR